MQRYVFAPPNCRNHQHDVIANNCTNSAPKNENMLLPPTGYRVFKQEKECGTMCTCWTSSLLICVLQVWAAAQPSIAETRPACRRVWVGQAKGRTLNGTRPVSMEEALATGLAYCPNHKVHKDSAQASELCMHISRHICVRAECKYTLITSDWNVCSVFNALCDVLFSTSHHTF